MRTIRLYGAVLAATALAFTVVACTPQSTAPPGTPTSILPVSTADAIDAVATTGAQIADAMNIAPPATLSRTTIDDKAVHIAFVTFDGALTIIDQLVVQGTIVRNSPRAVSLRAAVLDVKKWLNAASEAQRAGNASTYSAALSHAKMAVGAVSTILKQ